MWTYIDSKTSESQLPSFLVLLSMPIFPQQIKQLRNVGVRSRAYVWAVCFTMTIRKFFIESNYRFVCSCFFQSFSARSHITNHLNNHLFVQCFIALCKQIVVKCISSFFVPSKYINWSTIAGVRLFLFQAMQRREMVKIVSDVFARHIPKLENAEPIHSFGVKRDEKTAAPPIDLIISVALLCLVYLPFGQYFLVHFSLKAL